MWLKNARFQRLGGGWLESFGLRLWSCLQFTALRSRKDAKVVRLLQEIHDEKRSLPSEFEAFIVYSLARAHRYQPGDFAKVGVYKAASAKLISEAKGDKTPRLFDTFERLPAASRKDSGRSPAAPVFMQHDVSAGIPDGLSPPQLLQEHFSRIYPGRAGSPLCVLSFRRCSLRGHVGLSTLFLWSMTFYGL